MIISRTHDGTVEIAIYETDRIVIAFNRGGSCVARFTVAPEMLKGTITDIVLPSPPPIHKENSDA